MTAGWFLAASAASTLATGAPALARHEARRMAMGSAFAIVAYGPERPKLAALVDEAFDEVDRIDRLMSHYKTDSPLSRLNREAALRPVAVEPELFDFIAECLRYSRESGGAFDVTVGPLMKAWGFFRGGGRIPADGELLDLRERVGYRHVVLDTARRSIHFDRPGVELDLGGIAKGYAVDRVVALLRSRQVPAALVSAGGSTVFALGAPPGRKDWEVRVQDPVNPDRVAFSLRLRDRALSVSGSAEKSFEAGGRRYGHVLDPRTARPVEGVLGVAVLADSGTAGDALDNAFFVQGVAEARLHLRRLGPTEAFFFLPKAKDGWTLVRLRN